MIGTVILETGLFIICLGIYLRSTAAKDRIGKYGLWSLAALLVMIYFANLFGPPPPSERAIAIAGNAGWLFVLWAYWVDRHMYGESVDNANDWTASRWDGTRIKNHKKRSLS